MPLFISTRDGNVVPYNHLMQYATKAANGTEQSQTLLLDRFGAEYSLYGLLPPLYDMDTLIRLLEIDTYHSRCCSLKAIDTAGSGFGLRAAPGYEEMVEEEEKRVRDFLLTETRHGRPIDAILCDCMIDYEALGILAIEVVRELYGANEPPALVAHVPAHTLRIHQSGNKFMQKRGALMRWFKSFGYQKDVDKDNGNEYEVGALAPDKRASEVIWVNAFSGRSDFYGMAQAIPALGAIEGLAALRDFNIDFFRNHGIPAYAIYITGDYSLGEALRVRTESDGSGTIGEVYDASKTNHTMSNFEYKIVTQIKQHLSNVAANPNAPLIVAIPGATTESRVNVEFKPLAVEVREASFRLYRKDNRDEVIVAHGVPAYRLGLTETGSLGGSTAVESTRIYRDSVIRPRKKALASVININLVWQALEAPSVEFFFEDLDLAEEDHEKEVADFLFKNAAATPNQLRAVFGKQFGWEMEENAPALDTYYLDGQPIYSPQPTQGASSSLNGAQVASLLEVLAAVAAKTLTRESAVALIERAFLIPTADAERIVGQPEPPPPAPVAAPPVTDEEVVETAEGIVEAVKGLNERMTKLVIGRK